MRNAVQSTPSLVVTRLSSAARKKHSHTGRARRTGSPTSQKQRALGGPCEIRESYWDGEKRVVVTGPGWKIHHAPRRTWRVIVPYAATINVSKTGNGSLRPVWPDHLTRFAEHCHAPEFDPCLFKLEQPIFSNRGQVFPTADEVPFSGYVDEVHDVMLGGRCVGKRRYGYVEHRRGGFLNFDALSVLPPPSRLSYLVVESGMSSKASRRSVGVCAPSFQVSEPIEALFSDRRISTAFDLRAAIDAATGGLENVNDKGREGALYARCPLCDDFHEHQGPQQFRLFDCEPGRKALSCACFDSACPVYEGVANGLERVKFFSLFFCRAGCLRKRTC